MGISAMRKAVFLDRDGVINSTCGLDDLGHPESPLRIEDFQIFPFVGRAIKEFNRLGYLVFVVTNQPAVAKGKMTLDDLAEMSALLHLRVAEAGGNIKKIYTCLHHPDEKQVVYKSLLRDCDCRKPKAGLLFQAAQEFKVDLGNSWMIGDSAKDIVAGKSAGCRTILVLSKNMNKCSPDFTAKDLTEAVKIIQEGEKNEKND